MTKILIVDDEPDIRGLVGRWLTTAGHDVVSVSNGQQAHQAALAHEPDAILLDIVMPGMGGMAVLDQLKNDSKTVGIPIIILTSHDTPRVKYRSVAKGAAAVLAKPTTKGVLQSTLRGLLDKPEPNTPATTSPEINPPAAMVTPAEGNPPAAIDPPEVQEELDFQPHDFDAVAREFIGEFFGFTWQDQFQKISQVGLNIKKVNRDTARRVYHLEGSALVQIKDDTLTV